MPAQFLRADGFSVPPFIETSELHTLACHAKEADVMMCDGKRRRPKCRKKHGKQCVVFCNKQEEQSFENK